MNSPGMIAKADDMQEENGKDWSKEETSKNPKSPPQSHVPQQMIMTSQSQMSQQMMMTSQPQVQQQMMMKPENYNQFVVGYPPTFKDSMQGHNDGPRFDSSVRTEQMNRAESVPRYESNHRVDTVPRYPTTYQRFAGQSNDCFQLRKKLKSEEEENDASESIVPGECADDNEAFGRVVAAQLRSMNKVQKIIAQRLISEICFRGQLQYLQPTSSLSQQTVVQPQTQQQAVYAARPQRYVRSGQEITYLHPQALRQVIQPAGSNDFHNVQQSHSEQPAANINPMESYNL